MNLGKPSERSLYMQWTYEYLAHPELMIQGRRPRAHTRKNPDVISAMVVIDRGPKLLLKSGKESFLGGTLSTLQLP